MQTLFALVIGKEGTLAQYDRALEELQVWDIISHFTRRLMIVQTCPKFSHNYAFACCALSARFFWVTAGFYWPLVDDFGKEANNGSTVVMQMSS